MYNMVKWTEKYLSGLLFYYRKGAFDQDAFR